MLVKGNRALFVVMGVGQPQTGLVKWLRYMIPAGYNSIGSPPQCSQTLGSTKLIWAEMLYRLFWSNLCIWPKTGEKGFGSSLGCLGFQLWSVVVLLGLHNPIWFFTVEMQICCLFHMLTIESIPPGSWPCAVGVWQGTPWGEKNVHIMLQYRLLKSLDWYSLSAGCPHDFVLHVAHRQDMTRRTTSKFAQQSSWVGSRVNTLVA